MSEKSKKICITKKSEYNNISVSGDTIEEIIQGVVALKNPEFICWFLSKYKGLAKEISNETLEVMADIVAEYGDGDNFYNFVKITNYKKLEKFENAYIVKAPHMCEEEAHYIYLFAKNIEGPIYKN